MLIAAKTPTPISRGADWACLERDGGVQGAGRGGLGERLLLGGVEGSLRRDALLKQRERVARRLHCDQGGTVEGLEEGEEIVNLGTLEGPVTTRGRLPTLGSRHDGSERDADLSDRLPHRRHAGRQEHDLAVRPRLPGVVRVGRTHPEGEVTETFRKKLGVLDTREVHQSLADDGDGRLVHGQLSYARLGSEHPIPDGIDTLPLRLGSLLRQLSFAFFCADFGPRISRKVSGSDEPWILPHCG
jgi:hypothetical protein